MPVRCPLLPAEFATRVELLTAQILPKATTNTLLFMNGSDHLEPQDGLPATIAAANDMLAHIKPEHKKIIAQIGHLSQNGDAKPLDGIRVQIGTLPQYVATIRQHFQDNGHEELLQTLHGEMRSSQYSHLLPAVLSTRMWIKQQNTADRTPAGQLGGTADRLGLETGRGLSSWPGAVGLEISLAESSPR